MIRLSIRTESWKKFPRVREMGYREGRGEVGIYVSGVECQGSAGFIES